VRVRHLPGGAARAGSTAGRVLVQVDPPSAAQNGRGGAGEIGEIGPLELCTRVQSIHFGSLACTKLDLGQPEHAIAPAYAPFLAVEDSTTTSVAEDSIISHHGPFALVGGE
jgi:hypothetical protein